MKALYVRVSSVGQNADRQKKEGFIPFEDTCSGSIAFAQRPGGSKIMKLEGLKELHVHSIDRLGRNTLDIMQTIQILTAKGVNVVSEKEGLQTLINGKENPVSKLMIGILGTLAEFELSRIKERQKEGIEKAKAKGGYGGRKLGSVMSDDKILNKHYKVVNALKAGKGIREIAKTKGMPTAPTIIKIKNILGL